MFQKQERLIAACLVGALLALVSRTAQAQAPSAQPLKIGYGISQTGGLAPNGTSALLAQKIWEEDINIKGGLLGRPIKLIHYDNQSNPATVPAIYQKPKRPASRSSTTSDVRQRLPTSRRS